MAYTALYRAYRPQKFSEVVGQQHIIKTLQNAIRLNKVAHAYLFCGPRGTGKTSLAKILAKALNCERGPATEPCDECEICLGIQKGTIPDVIEIDAASNNGADDIRSLRDSVKYLPSVGKYKVYIIDEVHMLSNAAFNALLKTLEEPPKHVIFVLATTEPYKLPNTILSRCQRFDFQSLSIEDISKRLKVVCEQERISIDEEALYQIASSAEGAMRDALSLLDQAVSFSVSDTITLSDVLSVSGNVSSKTLNELLNACLDQDGAKALMFIDRILKEGKEVPRVINDLMLFLRDTLLYKNNAKTEDKLLFHQEDFQKFAKTIYTGVIYFWLDVLNESLNNMRFSNQKRAFLELAILKMADAKLQRDESVEDRLSQLERRLGEIKEKENTAKEPTVPSVKEIEPVKETIVPQTSVSQSAEEIDVRQIQEILNTARKDKKAKLSEYWNRMAEDYASVFIVQILVAGELVAVNEDSFIVVLQDVGFCNRLMSYESFVKIREILRNYQLNFKDYICIPKAVWNKIKADYRLKYRPDQPMVELSPISTGVLKRKVPSQNESPKESTLEEQVQEYFNEKVEMVEE